MTLSSSMAAQKKGHKTKDESQQSQQIGEKLKSTLTTNSNKKTKTKSRVTRRKLG